eukprot:TRINITY_DN5576_c0_g1_i1.p1 TRINITY_DN5576_c0_g1~~TRINITY_DN5576_c0_g1_i1.p1  ORF type:complete len:281 (-),score=72.68 TRINITY_DN5576_c0_g1_i1:244-1086(-)
MTWHSLLQALASNSKHVQPVLMLSNTQFVENRVYEDEDNDDDVDEKDSPVDEEEDTAVKVIQKFTNALNHGLGALDYYAKPTTDASVPEKNSDVDSDEESDDGKASEPPDSTIPKPYEPAEMDDYNNKPLPFVIGTRPFLTEGNIGLPIPEFMNMSDIEEETDDEDDGSESETGSSESGSSETDTSGSESVTGSETDEDDSDGDFGSDSADSVPKAGAIVVHPKANEETDSGDDVWGSDSEEDKPKARRKSTRKPTAGTDEVMTFSRRGMMKRRPRKVEF